MQHEKCYYQNKTNLSCTKNRHQHERTCQRSLMKHTSSHNINANVHGISFGTSYKMDPMEYVLCQSWGPKND